MANIKFNRKEFEKEVKLTDENKDKITMFGTPLESLSEEEIEIEVFPNRPDLLSLQGYLRALKSFLGKEPGLKKYKIRKPKKNYKVEIDKSVKEVRPYTVCAIIENLELNEEKIKEIIDVQEKIHKTFGRDRKKLAIGIYPLEKIKLPIRYKAKKPKKIKFKPLEAKRKMNGRQILSRHPTGREYGHLLENEEKYPVFIDSKDDILSMPPIINSNKTGKINEETEKVFIECSGFDLRDLQKTLNMIVTVFAEMDANVYQMDLKYPREIMKNKNNITTPDLKPETMEINLDKVNKLLGLDLNKKKINKLLERMGYNYKKTKNEVEIPPWRTDILHPVDITEDIAIAYGYDNFEPEIPEVDNMGKTDKKEDLKSKMANILIGLDMIEVSTHNLVTKEELKKLRKKREKIEVEDSRTKHEILRPEMLPSILQVFSKNVKSEYPQKIFEIGTCFSKNDKEDTMIEEKDKLAIGITPGNYTDIKQTLDYLFRMLNIDYEVDEKEVNEYEFIEGRTASIMVGEKEIGYIGEVHPSLLKSWSLKMPLAYLEIDFGEIFEALEQ